MQEQYPMLGRYVIPDMPTSEELLPFLKQIDRNQWYSNFGPLVTQFEEQLRQHLLVSGPDIALTTLMTCYHALQIGLQLFRLPLEAKVLVPAVTFPACPLAVRHAGAEPILADIDEKTWQLSPTTARIVAQKMPIHAVMPVALYGVPVDSEAWDRFSEDTGIPVIIDAAAAFEAQKVPKRSLVAYSLHATKPFSIGEGGILVSRNADWIDEARCRSNFGTQHRITLFDGGNAKLSEYLGAVGLAQYKRWDMIKQRRKVILHHYQSALKTAGLPVSLQVGIDTAVVSAFMLKTHQSSATKMTNMMNARGIMAHRMYLPPLYHHPYFSDLLVVDQEGRSSKVGALLEQKMDLMKHSETLHQSVFGLPFHAFLTSNDIQYAVSVMAEILEKNPS